DERDLVIMALVNTNVDPTIPPRWAAALRTVSGIPGIATRTIGTKVPAAAVSGQANSNEREHWQQISPMPIACGTPDQEVVDIARKSIPPQESQILERARKRLTDVKATKYDLLVL